MNVVIIKYNAGNIQSVQFALQRSGVQATISDDPAVIQASDKVIFPGVGEASTAMTYLKEKKLDGVIKNLTQPVLGICLGMQLLCAFSEENNTVCLNVFDKVIIRRFNPPAAQLKVPQVGWNTISRLKGNLFKSVTEDSYCYFVHSYYAEENAYSTAITEYCNPYCSAMQRSNFYGVQFHPEKSADTGKQILENFLSI